MSAYAPEPALDTNENFISADDDSRELTSHDVLPQLFEHGGMVTFNTEDTAASAWEKANNRAVLRSWEIGMKTRTAYNQRVAEYRKRRGIAPVSKLSMDPAIAEAEIDRLMRGNPEENADRINTLRVDVLGLEPVDFTPAKQTPFEVPPPTPEQMRRTNFLVLSHKNQMSEIAKMEDVEFLGWIAENRSAKIMPLAKKTAQDRIAELAKAAK
jgi:hypothetical protein